MEISSMGSLRYWGVCLIGIGLALTVSFSTSPSSNAQETPTGQQPWDLKILPQAGTFVFYDSPAEASQTGKPLDIGDFDGNGCGDIAITGQNGSFGANEGWRNRAGHLRIVMNMCTIGGQMTTTGTSQPHSLLTIHGAYAGDMAGTETAVGDINGDGYDDLLVSAQNNDGRNAKSPNAGSVYLVLGSADFAQNGNMDLLTPPANVIVFAGASPNDRFGIWVETGDFNGDNYDDMLIGANQADGENDQRINAGEVWILYGGADLGEKYGQLVDMATPPSDATRIIGTDYDDLLGSCVWGADLNGDEFDDVIMSAALWRGSAGIEGNSFGGGDGPANTRYNSGDVYILFGHADLAGQTIDLAASLDETGQPIDQTLTVVYGADENDLLGEEITTGDLDGDGIQDLVLGTLIGDGLDNQLVDSGEAWVIYTGDAFAGEMFDLASPDFSRMTVIYIDQPVSKGGDTLRVADIDQDGIGDLLYGAPDYDPVGYDLKVRSNAGMLAVIFGEKGGLPRLGNYLVLPGDVPANARIRYIVGADENDMMAYALAVYDVDGDGTVDIAPNAMGGDGVDNRMSNAGEIYVISGQEFLNPAHDFTGNDQPDVQPSAVVATPTLHLTPLPTFDTSLRANANWGRIYYQQGCAGCHGANADGEGVGITLIDSTLVRDSSDEELLHFLEVGRSADDLANQTGVAMPAFGGQVNWGSQEMWHIIAYLRQLIAKSG